VTSFTVTLRPLDYGTATRGNQSLTVVILSVMEVTLSAEWIVSVKTVDVSL
jgi:hypothetical protein